MALPAAAPAGPLQTVPVPPAAPRAAPAEAGALRRLWAVLILMLLGTGVGGAWDRSYHVTHAFDTFYSPPHLFIYSTFLIVAAVVASLVLAPRLRSAFGDGLRLFPLPFPVPGPLFILGGGVAAVGLAGLLDDLWHSSFGLDETGWSAPHAMLGWGLLVAALGFVASRLALAPRRPWARATPYLVAYLVLAFSATPFLGPLYGNNTPATVRATALIPVLQAQPPAQHTFRIYLQWNVDRTNPLFPPLAALWAGVALALLRALDPRPRLLLAATLAFTLVALVDGWGAARYLDQFLPVSQDLASWLPLPLLPAALALVLLPRLRLLGSRAWAAAGLLFGLLAYLAWGRAPYALLLVPLAAPAMLLGARVGGVVGGLLRNPREAPLRRFVPLAGIAMPLLLGLVDLALRSVTP